MYKIRKNIYEDMNKPAGPASLKMGRILVRRVLPLLMAFQVMWFVLRTIQAAVPDGGRVLDFFDNLVYNGMMLIYCGVILLELRWYFLTHTDLNRVFPQYIIGPWPSVLLGFYKIEALGTLAIFGYLISRLRREGMAKQASPLLLWLILQYIARPAAHYTDVHFFNARDPENLVFTAAAWAITALFLQWTHIMLIGYTGEVVAEMFASGRDRQTGETEEGEPRVL